jgi:hypothetical protein
MATNPLLILDANSQPQVSPSVSSRWVFDETSAVRFVAQRDVILLSYMEGGPANELVAYIGLDELQSVYDPENLHILGSDLADYLVRPSFDANIRGAYRIYVVRLGQPTASTFTLLDGASAPVLRLDSADTGTYTNKLSVEVASGTTVGKRVTLRFRQESTVLDNLRNAFHLAYTGNGSAATVTVTRSADRATRLQTTLTGATDGSIALDLDLTQDAFATTQQLVTYLNGQNGYRAQQDRYGDPLLPTYELDAVAGTTLRTPVALVIRYVGTGTAATLTTTTTTFATAVVGGPGGEALTLNLTAPATATLGQLVATIDSLAAYTCALGPDADPDALCLNLFALVTSQDIRTADYSLTAQPGRMDTVLHAGLGSIVYAINTRSTRVLATRIPAAITIPANRAQTFFAGGTNPVPTLNDWLNALEVIEQEDLIGGILFPVTTNPIMQDAVNAWVTEQHTHSGKSFRGFYAPPDNTDAEDAKALALGINSTFGELMYQPVVAASGVTEQAPLYPVAMYCGGAAGALPTQSVTRMVLRCRSLPARAKLSKAQREDLLSNGVTVLEEVKGVGVRIALAVTTSLSPDRIDRILSESMARDVIEQRIKVYVEPLIPHWAMMDFMPQVKGAVFNALSSLKDDGIISEGRDTNGRILPAWLPAQVSIQAGIMKIVVHVYIGGEIDHIQIFGTISYQRFELTVPASA